MKKIIAAVLTVMMILSLAACAGAETKSENTQEQTTAEQTQEQTETYTPDVDWNLPETIEMTDGVRAVFDKAMDGLTGVNYEPVGYLGEKDGVYCILCS